MSKNDPFDQRLMRNAQHYAKLYPSILARFDAAYRASHPMVLQITRAMARASEHSVQQREARLRADHGLSPQEIRTALHLIDGGSVASCAAAHEVAPSTVRSHLKSIFAKTGVTRQAELPQLLQGGRADQSARRA